MNPLPFLVQPMFILPYSHPHIAHRVRRLTLGSNWVNSITYLEAEEEITKRTILAYYLPFDLGRFVDHPTQNIQDVL